MMHHEAGDAHRYEGHVSALLRNRCFWAAVLLGIGTMAAVDEIVFHQILAWHHFYDRSTPAVGLAADGLLHAGELLAFAGGFFLMMDARRSGAYVPGIGLSGYLIGLGAFQLFDAVIDHKVLRVHQIRYGVDIVPYDIAWILSAVLLLAAGALVAIRAARHVRRRGNPG